MSGDVLTALIIGLVILAVLVIVALVLLVPAMRRRRLRARFGPEYDRMVETSGDRREAEQELAERERRHDKLQLRELPDEAKDRYAQQWRSVQEHFVDSPHQATGEADRLITQVMSERGYPTQNFEQQAADLSVEHARTLNSYRAAHGLAELVERRTATTEDMRQAMVHYRAVFAELVERDVAPDTREFADAEHDGRIESTSRHDGRLAPAGRNDGHHNEPGQIEGEFDDRAPREHEADEHARPHDVDADQRIPRAR